MTEYNETKWVGVREVSGELIKVADIRVREYHHIKSVLPYPKSITVTQPKDTAADAVKDGTAQTPDSGEVWYISYLRLITPVEMKANILVNTEKTTDLLLLTTHQDVSLDNTYDVRAIWEKPIRVTSINIRSVTAVKLTADRTATLEFGGRVADKLW